MGHPFRKLHQRNCALLRLFRSIFFQQGLQKNVRTITAESAGKSEVCIKKGRKQSPAISFVRSLQRAFVCPPLFKEHFIPVNFFIIKDFWGSSNDSTHFLKRKILEIFLCFVLAKTQSENKIHIKLLVPVKHTIDSFQSIFSAKMS